MNAALHGCILRRHAERVPAHGVQNIVALGPLVARHHIAHGVIPHMAHVDAARGIGEHFEDVIFLRSVAQLGSEGVPLIPQGLPLGFRDLGVIAAHSVKLCCSISGSPAIARTNGKSKTLLIPGNPVTGR